MSWAEFKRLAKRLYLLWRLIAVALLSAVLIPFFLSQGTEGRFYSFLVPLSVLAYLLITYGRLRLRAGKLRRWLSGMANFLFLGLVALTLAFVFLGLGLSTLAPATLVTAAVLYALFLQKILFLRLVGV